MKPFISPENASIEDATRKYTLTYTFRVTPIYRYPYVRPKKEFEETDKNEGPIGTKGFSLAL